MPTRRRPGPDVPVQLANPDGSVTYFVRVRSFGKGLRRIARSAWPATAGSQHAAGALEPDAGDDDLGDRTPQAALGDG